MGGLKGFGDRVVAWLSHHASIQKDPESMAGWLIVTIWCVLAGLKGGAVLILILVTMGWFLHLVTVDSGNHVLLWLTTSMLLILIVFASEITFDGLSPVLLAASGVTALLHNELVRLNYARRRNATIHQAVYHASGLALTVAAALAVVGIAVAQILASGEDRSWLWLPAAAGAVVAVGLALAIGPARNASEASKERWLPGGRIPPQPLRSDSDL